MTGSLQEQLLKAGLVNKQQVNDARKKKSKQFKKGKQKNEPSLAKAYAQRQHAERKERDQELNRRREEAKRRKELKEQLKKIIVPASKNKNNAEIARFFEFARKIRKIYVTEAQQNALNDGRLGIAYHAGRHHLVEAEVIERVKALNPDAVSFFAPDVNEDEDMDEHYAQFEVPDDLTW